MLIINIHQRVIDAPVDAIAPLIAAVGGNADRLWPAPPWSPMRLDRPLAVGARGGHGQIRYRVTEWEPGQYARFDFEGMPGLTGFHAMRIETWPGNTCRLEHRIEAKTSGTMQLIWPLMIRWLHDALVEDLLDNAELLATGRPPAKRNQWSWWVRVLRRRMPAPAAPRGVDHERA